MFDAYLDIETTGLSRFYNEITVIGIYLVDGRDSRLVQFVGDAITRDNLFEP
ncbi:MAG: ribonuclease H-like domain-containing protein [Dehalococcoidia bacterium]